MKKIWICSLKKNKLKKFEVKKYNTKNEKKITKKYNLSIKNLKCKVYVIKK